MAITAHGATFVFTGTRGEIRANVTALSVTNPTAEVVDMTGPSDPLGFRIMVPTGDVSGGSIDVEYLATANGGVPDGFVSDYGTLTFDTPVMSVSRKVVLASVDKEARVGELVRGTLRFTLTDYGG